MDGSVVVWKMLSLVLGARYALFRPRDWGPLGFNNGITPTRSLFCQDKTKQADLRGRIVKTRRDLSKRKGRSSCKARPLERTVLQDDIALLSKTSWQNRALTRTSLAGLELD